MPEYKRKPNISCIVCSTPIYRRPIEISKNNGRVFCSAICYGLSSRKEKPCLVCNKLILAGLNKKTCSRSCANKHRAGIKYNIGRPNDKANSLRILKTKLMKTRSKKCERCDYNRYEILQIHHKNRKHTDNRFDNLEIICPNCHYEEHYMEKSFFRGGVEKISKNM